MTDANETRLTKHQAAVIGCYTGTLCGPFNDVRELAERLLGGPIFTHQFANPSSVAALKTAALPLFMALCFNGEG
jgi:hypothetical protein